MYQFCTAAHSWAIYQYAKWKKISNKWDISEFLYETVQVNSQIFSWHSDLIVQQRRKQIGIKVNFLLQYIQITQEETKQKCCFPTSPKNTSWETTLLKAAISAADRGWQSYFASFLQYLVFTEDMWSKDRIISKNLPLSFPLQNSFQSISQLIRKAPYSQASLLIVVCSYFMCKDHIYRFRGTLDVLCCRMQLQKRIQRQYIFIIQGLAMLTPTPSNLLSFPNHHLLPISSALHFILFHKLSSLSGASQLHGPGKRCISLFLHWYWKPTLAG